MKTIRFKASGSAKQTNLAICLGFFDGLHTAHQTLMRKTIEEGRARGLKTAMLTFSKHILSYIKKEPFAYITSLRDKIEAARAMGFDYFYVMEVSDSLVRMSPASFIDRFLINQNVVVVGFDFTFGNFGVGNAELLKSHSEFETIVIEEIDFLNEKIGSSRIRECILCGNMEEVTSLIGKPYSIKGPVVKGKSRGKAMGFPTANIKNAEYLLPKRGVYVATVKVGNKHFKGLANVGNNPTFGDNFETIEVYILDFTGQIYGRIIKLFFVHYIREEIKFNTTEELINKMIEDEVIARNYFTERGIR